MQSSAVLPAAVSQLLNLFETELEGIAFPDVDLTRLQEHAQRCLDQAAEVEQIEASLAAAHVRAAEGRKQLLALSAKAVAYAQVYASDEPELSAKLQAIQSEPGLSRGPRRGKRRNAKSSRGQKTDAATVAGRGTKKSPRAARAAAAGQGDLGLQGAPASAEESASLNTTAADAGVTDSTPPPSAPKSAPRAASVKRRAAQPAPIAATG